MAYLGRQPVLGNFVKLDAITVVNGQAAYTMQNGGVNFTDYTTVNQFLVSLNGTIQAATDSFTVSGSTITFASNLSTGDVIDFIIVFGNSLSAGTPTDGSVTNAKISYPLAKSGATVSTFNRTTSDGNILELQKDASLSGSVGSVGGNGGFYISGANNVGLQFNNVNDEIRPCNSDGSARDNAIDLGNATRRFKDLYLGGGLYVGGTGTANKLDDYEEGTWTPIYEASSSNPTITYDGFTHGVYNKVGNVVFARGFIRTDSVSGGSGFLKLAGFPFNFSSQPYGATVLIQQVFSWGTAPAKTANDSNADTVNLYDSSGNDITTSSLATGSNSNQMTILAVYQV